MLSAFTRAFKTPDLRRKLLFTLGIVVLFRLGSFVPTPNVDYNAVQACIAGARDDASTTFLGMANLFSGGALLQLSIFALGIMPYITASIIVQLLTVVIPRFEALKKEGQQGQAKMNQYTRYLTIALRSCSRRPSSPSPATPASSSATRTARTSSTASRCRASSSWSSR